MIDNTGILTYESMSETQLRERLTDKLINAPHPKNQLLSNLGLFIDSKNLSRILFLDHLYRQILDVQGCVVEFGTRWGQNMAVFAALRGIYEPFNRHRKLIGFDTFEGFPSVANEDGESDLMRTGNLATTPGYADYLTDIIKIHEALNPIAHVEKFAIRVGDATEELPRYLQEAPHTIIALAYFDFDLYEPTLKCLEAIRPRLTKGSVLGFDELNDPDSPGETLALMESFGLNSVRLKRFPHASRVSYFVVD